MTATFSSARLEMRPLLPSDAEALFEAYGDDAVMQWMTGPADADIAQTRERLAARPTGPGFREWAFQLSGTARAIGTLIASERRTGVVEIGYLMVRQHWGQGYAREAVTRLLDLLLREEGHRRVFADTDPDNAASNGLLKALGFTLEGRLRAEWETHIGVRDTLLWGLLGSEWVAR